MRGFKICTLHEIMPWAEHEEHERDEVHTGFWWKTKRPFGRPRHKSNERLVGGGGVKKQNVWLWTEFIWVRMGSNGRHL